MYTGFASLSAVGLTINKIECCDLVRTGSGRQLKPLMRISALDKKVQGNGNTIFLRL